MILPSLPCVRSLEVGRGYKLQKVLDSRDQLGLYNDESISSLGKRVENNQASGLMGKYCLILFADAVESGFKGTSLIHTWVILA